MTQTIPLGSDARERFVLEIAKVLPPARIVEAHFFAPLRQGQIETGVCVLGALPEGAEPLPVDTAAEVAVTETAPSEVLDNGLPPDDQAASGSGSLAAEAADEGSTDHLLSKTPEQSAEGTPAAAAYPAGARISSRHVVYSARYRWTRKGPDRGKWECEVVAEADAPLLTVEAVVQGVRQRASEPLEVEKLDGDTVRGMIAKAQQQWQKTA